MLDFGALARERLAQRGDGLVPGKRRQRASAAASSVLTRGLRSTSEIPASASASTLTSIVDVGGEQHRLPRRDLVQRVSQIEPTQEFATRG